MSRKKIIWSVILIVVAGGALYGYKEYSRTNKDLSRTRADISASAADLVREYESNDAAANTKYLGKIIDVTGSVKEVTKDEGGYFTIVLGDTAGLSSVRCAMDSSHQDDAARVSNGSSVMIRGACTGFNKDDMGLGSDVILNRCVLVPQKNK